MFAAVRSWGERMDEKPALVSQVVECLSHGCAVRVALVNMVLRAYDKLPSPCIQFNISYRRIKTSHCCCGAQ